MAEINTSRLIQLLKKDCRRVSRDGYPVNGGLRVVYLPFELFYSAITQEHLEAIFYLLRSRLPADATIVEDDQLGDGSIIRMVLTQDEPASFKALYVVLFCSSEWDAIPEGGKIPGYHFNISIKLEPIK